MRQRRKVLLFNGIAETPDADLTEDIVSLVNNKLGLAHVSSTSIKRCHSIEIKNDKRPRPVLVHFQEHSIKFEVWKNKTKLKGSQISVSEFLTVVRQSVHKISRKHFGLKNVWTLDGIIYIKLPTGERAKICAETEIEIKVK